MSLKISQLPEVTIPQEADVFPISVNLATTPITKKITFANLLASVPLLAGRTGGQKIIGGTAVSDILKLQGTSGNGTLTSPAIQGLVGNNGATVAFTVLNNGNVGIGTTSPSEPLTVHKQGAGQSPGMLDLLTLFGTNDHGDYGLIEPRLKFNVGKKGIAALTMAAIYGRADDYNVDAGGFLTIQTADTTGTLQDRVSINKSGNVGIGTTNPAVKLDINAGTNTASTNLFHILSNDGTQNRDFYITTTGSSGGNWQMGASSNSRYILKGYSVDLVPYTVAEGGSADIRVTGNFAVNTNNLYVQQSTGNVGIGTTSPIISGTGKLHMAADTMRLGTARTPASAGAAGNAGEICWDASYIYVCVATNTWVRAAIATW